LVLSSFPLTFEYFFLFFLKKFLGLAWWLTPIILDTPEAEIGRIAV
jgi:hypothetical protein